jgi:type IV pilus assembly protein PilM
VANSVIGLDIGTTRVRAVEVQRGRGAPTVQRYGEVPLPLGAVRDGEVVAPEVVVPALKQLWSQGKFSQREVVIGVGNQRVMVRNLSLPWMPMAHLRASLPFQVQDILPVPVEDALLDYYPTEESNGPDGRQVHGLLVAATRDTVQANLAAAESAGLRPTVVDLNAFALFRAHLVSGIADRVVALIDIGAASTNVIVAAHGVPRLVRTLPTGGQYVSDAVAAAMNVAVVEADDIKRQVGVGFAVPRELEAAGDVINHVSQSMVESIRNTLVYYASNHPGEPIEMAILTGGGAYLNGLGQYISSATRLPVAMADLVASVSVARSAPLGRFPGVESAIAVPLGLAMAVAA